MDTKQNNSIDNIFHCFKNLSIEDSEFLSKNKTQVNYCKGETIFKQGAFAPHVLFVKKGLVKVFIQTGQKKHINISIAKSGDFMGFSSIFGKNEYQYSGMALAESQVCMIDKEALKNVIMRNVGFAVQITSRNCKNENRYIEIIKNLSSKHMRGKLASTLLYLTSEDFENYNLFEYLTRQDIADFSSITVESTVKFLKEFEKENLIKLNKRDIVIKDRKTLNFIDARG